MREYEQLDVVAPARFSAGESASGGSCDHALAQPHPAATGVLPGAMPITSPELLNDGAGGR